MPLPTSLMRRTVSSEGQDRPGNERVGPGSRLLALGHRSAMVVTLRNRAGASHDGAYLSALLYSFLLYMGAYLAGLQEGGKLRLGTTSTGKPSSGENFVTPPVLMQGHHTPEGKCS